jgi:NADP-dependent 3-hydroxy acid dehydrogenase YdfG
MFKDKVVIITGAAGGIGSTAAGLFTEKGAKVVLTDIREKPLKQCSDALAADGGDCRSEALNVTDPESWTHLIEKVLDRYGRIDILVNNAGVVHPGAAESVAFEKVQQQIFVNLMGTINGCRAVLPTFKKQGAGKIVNVASLGGIVPMPGEAVYSATKAGIREYSFSLIAELRKTPISVTVVCPDSVDTPQLAYELEHDEAVMSFIGEPLPPVKVAKAILRAAGSKKSEILVPGGMGLVCRIGMACPKLFFLVLPILEKTGAKTIQKRRNKKKG